MYKITWGGYFVSDEEDQDLAEKEFIKYIEKEEFDQYGRTWKELIEIEEIE